MGSCGDVYSSPAYLKLQEVTIQCHHASLVDTLDTHAAADVLYQLQLLSKSNHEEVTNFYVPRLDRTRHILRLIRSMPFAVPGLVVALTRTKLHTPLANTLWNTYKMKLREASMYECVFKEDQGELCKRENWVSLLYGQDRGYQCTPVYQTPENLDKNKTHTLHTMVDNYIKECLSDYKKTQAALPVFMNNYLQFNQITYEQKYDHQAKPDSLTPREKYARACGYTQDRFVDPHQETHRTDSQSAVHYNLPKSKQKELLSPSYYYTFNRQDSTSSSDDETIDDTSGECDEVNESSNEEENTNDDALQRASVSHQIRIDGSPNHPLPEANTYCNRKQQRWLSYVYDKLVTKINNGQYMEYYDLSRQYLLSNPGNRDLQYLLLSAEAATLLFQGNNDGCQEVLGQALKTMGGTSSPSASLLDVLAKQAWIHQQDGDTQALGATTSQATQILAVNNKAAAGNAAGWIYFNRARYLTSMAGTDLCSSKAKQFNEMALKNFELAMEHFKRDDEKNTVRTAMAMLLLGCGERLATVSVIPPIEDIKRARALISEVESSHIPYNLRPYVEIGLCDHALRLGPKYIDKAAKHAQTAINMASYLDLNEPLMMAHIRLIYTQHCATKVHKPSPSSLCNSQSKDSLKESLCQTQPKQCSLLQLSSQKLIINSQALKAELDLASCVKKLQCPLRWFLICLITVITACLIAKTL